MVFEAYVTNLGKYNKGVLAGAYLKFPATTEDVQALLKRIGVDGVRYEEIFITDFQSDVLGLYDCLNEYDNIDELNHLAHVLSELSESELEKFEAAIAYGEYTSSVKDLINLAQNLDCYDFIPGIEDEEDLGRYYIEELDALQVPEHLRNYIDYEAYGRDVSMEESSSFVPGGYVRRESDIAEVYYGREDIPEEHRIFAYPELNIRETLSAYKEVIDRSALDTEKRRLAPAKEER